MRFKLVVSLDDDWAIRAQLANLYPRDAVRLIGKDCTITSEGAVIDPNGNTIGRVEVE